MKISVNGSTLELELSVEFETDGTTARGLLRKGSTAWRLINLSSNNSEWIGSRRIEHGEAIKRALIALEREAAKESRTTRQAALAEAALRRD